MDSLIRKNTSFFGDSLAFGRKYAILRRSGNQSVISSEANHQFQHHFVLLRFLGDAAFGVEVFLVVQADVRAEGLAEAEGDTARQSVALVVGNGQGTRGFVAGLASLWSVIMSYRARKDIFWKTFFRGWS